MRQKYGFPCGKSYGIDSVWWAMWEICFAVLKVLLKHAIDRQVQNIM